MQAKNSKKRMFLNKRTNSWIIRTNDELRVMTENQIL